MAQNVFCPKICVVTAARSEYGLLRWLMQDIKDDPELELQVLVTGSHLAPEFGLTVNEITEQGFVVDAAVDMLLASSSVAATAKGMGLAGLGAADALARLAPDLLFVLGDRYELLPICSAALVMGIPMAHASGGDVTEGAIDDQIRHAVTKMAALHFPGSEDSARRIAQMGEEPWRIHMTGEAGLDNLRRLPSLPREAQAVDLGLDPTKDWAEDNFSFNLWGSANGRPQGDLFTTAPSASLLKFEINVTQAWSSLALQIIFTPWATRDTNGYIADGKTPRALWRPWQGLTSGYTTDGWVTVAIPLTEFKYIHDGSTAEMAGPGNYGGLTMFVYHGGIAGTSCNPYICIDNIRVVPAE